MSSVIHLTWGQVVKVKEALVVVEKIMTDCNSAELCLKGGLTVCMDPTGIRIEENLKDCAFNETGEPLEGGEK